MAEDRKQIARQLYASFSEGDRDFFERHLADDLVFSSPPDPRLDRPGFFEHRDGMPAVNADDIARLVESANEVIVTYELTRPDGTGGRNTEVLTFADDKVKRIEVYFGWDRRE